MNILQSNYQYSIVDCRKIVPMNRIICALLAIFALTSCKQPQAQNQEIPMTNIELKDGQEVATLGAGCFWCVEAIFDGLKGVDKVLSGYSGGFIKNPAYREVCNGTTGHAEVVQVFFDPEVITFEDILLVFFETHDPTTMNQQGADRGTQYRSAVFCHSEEQMRIAELAKSAANESGSWNSPVVTEIKAFSNFYVADNYHQDYFEENSSQPYCRAVIVPKLDKFKAKFKDKLKD
ncbi:MAG: peptide-methionine (S)-S-oxide reductase [Flavobacteriales bacterium]